MGSGLELAYQQARARMSAKAASRVIVLSDGDANVGPSSLDEMLRIIDRGRQDGVTLSTIGFGMGNYRAELMEQLGKRVVHSFEHYDRDTGISVYAAPSVKPGFFLYYDPIDTLAPEIQARWKVPAEQDAMIAAAIAAAGGSAAATAHASSIKLGHVI